MAKRIFSILSSVLCLLGMISTDGYAGDFPTSSPQAPWVALTEHTEVVTDPIAFEKSPEVISTAIKQLTAVEGNLIYAKNLSPHQKKYDLYKKGDALIDPETNKVLAYEKIYLGTAEVVKFGDPSTLLVLSSNIEINEGTHLFPFQKQSIDFSFHREKWSKELHGQIIHLSNPWDQVGEDQMVVINRGSHQGLKPGHILAISHHEEGRLFETGKKLPNGEVPSGPARDIGSLMVIRTYPELSFAWVLSSKEPVAIGDDVHNIPK